MRTSDDDITSDMIMAGVEAAKDPEHFAVQQQVRAIFIAMRTAIRPQQQEENCLVKPQHGSMVYWRFKGGNAYHFGYVTHTNNPDIIRLGRWSGDVANGDLADYAEIDWRPWS